MHTRVHVQKCHNHECVKIMLLVNKKSQTSWHTKFKKSLQKNIINRIHILLRKNMAHFIIVTEYKNYIALYANILETSGQTGWHSLVLVPNGFPVPERLVSNIPDGHRQLSSCYLTLTCYCILLLMSSTSYKTRNENDIVTLIYIYIFCSISGAILVQIQKTTGNDGRIYQMPIWRTL